MTEDIKSFLVILLILLAICLVVAVVMRLTRFIITIVALIIIIPILFTVLWGDGEDYVSKFASIFSPQIEQEINEGYQFYKEQDRQDPVVDLDQLEEYANHAIDSAKGAISSIFSHPEEDTPTKEPVFPNQ